MFNSFINNDKESMTVNGKVLFKTGNWTTVLGLEKHLDPASQHTANQIPVRLTMEKKSHHKKTRKRTINIY